jgi:transcriptional regulator with XRE-family HTH domain
VAGYKVSVARSARKGLQAIDRQLSLRIIRVLEALARLAQTSRPRVTAILNGNLEGVSTDLLLRLLGVLGVRVELKFRRQVA